MKKEKGITLVALVVTIIILLILAGVTLSIALSENGLFSQAKRAVEEYENSAKKEDESLKKVLNTIENIMQENIIEQKPLVTSLTTIDNKTRKAEDILGNLVVIPGGFKFAGKEGDTVEDGIIIEDDEKNQFVWIPVSNINKDGTGLIKTKDKGDVEITLGRYTFADSTQKGKETLVQKGSERTSDIDDFVINDNYKESTNLIRKDEGEGAESLEDFITSVETNHGYYIARYEASYKSNDKPYSKPSTSNSTEVMNNTVGMLWNFISEGEASRVSRNMYSGEDNEAKYVESDLVNSYAWDTAIVYIQAMGNENYANANRDTNGNTILKNTGETKDVKCNIYDMAGNVYELTTEYSIGNDGSKKYPVVSRGGYFGNNYHCTALRDSHSTSFGDYSAGFRPLLYLKK